MKRGFSAIELLVAIAIIAIVVAVMVVPLNNLRRRQAVNSDSEQVISLINEARSRTISAVGGAQHGVYVEADQLTLFQGVSYPGASIQVLDLASGVSVSTINLVGGGDVIIFDKITGKTGQSGTLVISLDADASQERTVLIESTGLAHLSS
ncbi:MAG: prepilin-type N-terminal cleavage/methylation domain-containing protein [Patescibacteria group bacterium]|nr:prepilin-type N-terminal cleavage/methylation domain-containing protein [Patescibacteria group bacterium]